MEASPLQTILNELSHPTRSILEMPHRVELCYQALALLPRHTNPRLWAALKLELGISLAQNPQSPRVENIEQALIAYQQALEIMTREAMPGYWATVMNNIAVSYTDRIRGERAENIDKAIAIYQQVLEIRTKQDMEVEWAETMNNMATAYVDRIHGERAENIEIALSLYQQALAIITRRTMPLAWAQIMNNLANAYRNRTLGERSENIETAIKNFEQALAVRSRKETPMEWAETLNNLALAYEDRILGDRAKNIEKAIAACSQALAVRTREASPIAWAESMNNLGNIYRNRILGERANNVELAIHALERGLEVRTQQTMPVAWAETMNNLGLAYVERIQGEHADNIEKAIIAYNAALQIIIRETMPLAWAKIMNNLANAYRSRIRGERTENIEYAITAHEKVLEVTPQQTMRFDWAETMNNLGIAYAERILGERAENMEKAIIFYRDALEVITKETTSLLWATIKVNLATAYHNRILGDPSENIEEAITAFQHSLEVITQDTMPLMWSTIMNNLANIYAGRLYDDRAEGIEQAIAMYQQSLTVRSRKAMPFAWATTMNNIAAAYSNRIYGDKASNIKQAIAAYQKVLQVKTVDLAPADHQITQRNLGNIYFEKQQWAKASAAYQSAVKAGRLLLDVAYTESGRKAEVTETAQLFACIAYCLFKLNKPNEAIYQLEQGKTRLLTEAVSLEESSLAKLSFELKQYLEEARGKVSALEAEMRLPPDASARRSDRELAEALRLARSELRQQIATIEQAHPDFLPTSLDVSTILTLIPPSSVLVAPFITSHGGATFVIPHGTTTVTNDHILPLPTLNTDYLSELLWGTKDDTALGSWLGAYDHFRQNEDTNAQKNWFQQINATTRKLWDTLMGPIYQRLQSLNLTANAPVLLMPQGGLGLLPLHAAWHEVNGLSCYFSDNYTVTYAPSAYALHISRQRAAQPERQARSLFAATNPTRDLPYTPVEGEAIAQLFPPTSQTILQETEAVAAAFATAAQGHTYIHYAGHGYYHWRDPLQSGLQLADKAYTLSDILSGLDLSTCRLVTLSACETGITEFQQAPDEYVGLPAGFLQAGAPAVISTLWAVNDLSTMLLMERFYQLHLQVNLDMASALRQAQLWLRDVTAQELATRFGEERMNLKGHRLTLSEASDYWRRFAALEPDSKPFAQPHYWAPFTFTGA